MGSNIGGHGLGNQTTWKSTGTTQTITTSNSASTAATNKISSQCYVVRLAADTATYYSIGDGAQTASSATAFIPANWVEYVRVNPGQSIAARCAATDGLVTTTAAGTFWITEVTA